MFSDKVFQARDFTRSEIGLKWQIAFADIGHELRHNRCEIHTRLKAASIAFQVFDVAHFKTPRVGLKQVDNIGAGEGRPKQVELKVHEVWIGALKQGFHAGLAVAQIEELKLVIVEAHFDACGFKHFASAVEHVSVRFEIIESALIIIQPRQNDIFGF